MKRVASFAVALSLIVVFAAPTFAQAASLRLILEANQTSAWSGALGNYKNANQKVFNATSSARDVYGTLQYAAPGGGWVTQQKLTVHPSNTAQGTTVLQTTAGDWRVGLDPVGFLTKDVYATNTLTAW